MIESLILETYRLPSGFEELFAFILCCRLAFFNYPVFYFNLIVLTSCRVSFSSVCTLRFIWAFICFVTGVVTFSAITANYFSCGSCFCVSVIWHLWHTMGTGPVLVLEYSGIRWLSWDMESVRLFFHVEGKEYCRSARAPWIVKTRFNYVFDE